MLLNIYIENVAVIEKASIDFEESFNILTGETGAGKSIIIDSINAIMGQRISRELIRSGCDSAIVIATFSDVSKSALVLLEEMGCDCEDGMFILQRQITAAGKNICKINGRPTPLSTLKKIGPALLNIYGQNEGYDFMTADSHLRYIDAVGEYDDIYNDYKQKYGVFSDIRKKLNDMQDNIQERERRIDLLQYQIQEIEDAELQDGELEELEERRRFLSNSEKIRIGLSYAYALLAGNDDEGAVSAIDNVNNSLAEISSLYPAIDELSQRIQSSYEELKDCQYEISNLLDEIDADPNELNEVEDRYDLIRSLSRKYGDTIAEILEYREKSQNELDELISFDENKEKLEQKFEAAKKELTEAAKLLTEQRTKTAHDFCTAVMQEMRFLDMPNMVMVPDITKCEYSSTGCDRLEILISANPGEEPKPLSKIASGGELSRIMLAIKTIVAEKDEISTLIFDEIDTGISGSAASKVGRKLQQLSKTHQVLCITHQAQIAALADLHLFISKNVSDGRTYTTVKRLDLEERKYELSRIIDGNNPSELSLKHAEEMLNSK